MRKCIFLLLLFPGLYCFAQPVSVRAFTDKNKVLLGEPFWLTLEIKSLNGAKPPAFKVDSIPHFEFVVRDSFKVTQKGDTTIYHQHYQLTSFDSGRWVIPSFALRKFVKTNSVLVDVVFTENFDPKQPYYDVQEIKGVPFKLDANLEKWWYIIAGLLIILTLIIYLLTAEKRSKPQRTMVSGDTPYKKAIRHLTELKQSKPEEKSFYAQLVEIFRTYVLERTGITSLQQTSNNLVEKIKPLMKDEVKYDSLSQVLYLCDFVKFAKYDPEDSEATSAFEVIEDSIHYIEETVRREPDMSKEVDR
ncbi:BatD family protein [Niabella ginsengisoli]|uniref:BatD family protein n=1 Tax=Niabella ginsengisoli TaxID=522298 RepID=A0ABS9SF06_9BACT|nr:BatD family protein [Niabella ginsengisoli]MCH5596930.1 BatD family protein [Niabella ginsengisoli]